MVNSFFFVPQAWSLSVEIAFYIIAPFLVLRSWWLLGLLLLASFGLRVVLYHRGYDFDPWSYRFFPNELAIFLLGGFSYSLYAKLKSKNVRKFVSTESVVILLSFVIAYPYLARDKAFSLWYLVPFILVIAADMAP